MVFALFANILILILQTTILLINGHIPAAGLWHGLYITESYFGGDIRSIATNTRATPTEIDVLGRI